MQYFKNQIIGGTRLDNQGEKLPKEFLQNICEAYKGKALVMYPHHDVSLGPIGKTENLRVVPSETEADEWDLIGDVELEDEASIYDFKGFSVGGSIPIHNADNQQYRLYLPIYGYNDSELISDLLEDESLTLDKWIKKGEVEGLALFSTMVVLIVSPVWHEFYAENISPRIRSFFKKHWGKLKDKKISLEYLQTVEWKGKEIHLRFTGIEGLEEKCFDPDSISGAIELVSMMLQDEKRDVEQVSLVFDKSNNEYCINWIELSNGMYLFTDISRAKND